MLKLKNEHVHLALDAYRNNDRLFIGVTDAYGLPIGNLTVNLPDQPILNRFSAYVDVNNFPDAPQFIEENKLGEFTGQTGFSFWCAYPLCQFDPDRLKELAPECFAQLPL